MVSFHSFVNAPDNQYTLVFVAVLYKKAHGQFKKKITRIFKVNVVMNVCQRVVLFFQPQNCRILAVTVT